jgi:hypothetical protein
MGGWKVSVAGHICALADGATGKQLGRICCLCTWNGWWHVCACACGRMRPCMGVHVCVSLCVCVCVCVCVWGGGGGTGGWKVSVAGHVGALADVVTGKQLGRICYWWTWNGWPTYGKLEIAQPGSPILTCKCCKARCSSLSQNVISCTGLYWGQLEPRSIYNFMGKLGAFMLNPFDILLLMGVAFLIRYLDLFE